MQIPPPHHHHPTHTPNGFRASAKLVIGTPIHRLSPFSLGPIGRDSQISPHFEYSHFRRIPSDTMPGYVSKISILTRLAYYLTIDSFRAMETEIQKRRKRREPGKPRFLKTFNTPFLFTPGSAVLFQRPLDVFRSRSSFAASHKS